MEQQEHFHYLSPKLELRSCPEKGGYGLFAVQPIKAGELLTYWGGKIVTTEELDDYSIEVQTHGIQVDEDLYMLPISHMEPADYFNHSCDPNAGMDSPASLVAMRDIAVGEEACFDYAMSDSSDYDEFTCHCEVPNCRKHITGHDWQLPELHERYRGYFSPYLQRRIDKLNNNGHHKQDELRATAAVKTTRDGK
jgi:hypothetical protein